MRSTAAAVASVVLACASGKPAPKPPAAPSGISAQGGDGQVTVLWNAVDAAIGYRIYSGEGALGEHADVGAVTSWTVTGLTDGHTYSFAVSALGVGGESALSAAVTATPKANPPLAIVSITPADAATAVPRNAAVVVKFNKPVQAPAAGCSGTVQISDDSFATCAAGAFASSDADATWTFTPAAALHGSAKYAVRVTTAQKDANGVALAAPFQSAGFTTALALTVSLSPSGTVEVRPGIVLTFNRAVDQSSVSSIETGTVCDASVRLSAGGACVAMTHAWSGNTANFTPTADLQPSTAYALTVTAGVKDSDGVPLDAPAGGGFTTIAAARVLSTDFQHIHVAWTSSNGAHLYWRLAGTSIWFGPQAFAGPAADATLMLTPGKTWDVRVAPLDSSGVEQAPHDLLAIATDFTGVASEWLAGQLAEGAKGGHFRFAWSDSEFFAAYSSSDESTTLQSANADALWIAFDTDPDADTAGEWQTQTGTGGQIIWPFKADFIVELKNASGGVQTNLRTVSTATWSAPSWTYALNGTLAEIRFPRSAIGSPAKARIALAAVATHSNAGDNSAAYTFDLAPAPAAPAIATFAQAASVPASFLVSFPADATSSAASTLSSGPLVHFKVTGASPAVQLKGNIAPLSYAAPLALPGGEASVNLGAATGELFFRFTDTGGDEFPSTAEAKDRVWTLSGAAESLPALGWNTAYSASHAFTLTFIVTGGTPTQVRGNVSELGSWGTGATLSGGPAWSTGPISFSAHDFTSTALEFKAYYGSSYEGGATNHAMNDDVINGRTLSWTAGDGTNF